MHRTALFLLLAFATGLAQAQTQELPKRKSGLWEITRTTTRTEGRAILTSWCIDEKTDNALAQLAEGLPNEACKVSQLRRDGEQLIVDATCTLGREKVVGRTHATVKGRFDSAYRVESKSSYDPPMRGKSEGTAILDAKWLGACKAGQKPGDVVLGKAKDKVATDTGSSSPHTGKQPLWSKQRDKSTPPAYAPPASAPPASAPPASATPSGPAK